MCDDNTSPLNVRNSPTGNIIDNLSCYKKLTIKEEGEETDSCDKWYKISYDKNGSSYIGYACGTYIKKYEIDDKTYNEVKSIIDKVNDYYLANENKVYCGNTSTRKQIKFPDNMIGEYLKSEFKDINELKEYVLSFLSKDLINIKLELGDVNKPKYYDNYYMIEDNLYCRNYTGKGVDSSYIDSYDIEVIPNNNETIVNVAYKFIKEGSKCTKDNLDNCSNGDFTYKIAKMTIKNNIITKIDFK